MKNIQTRVQILIPVYNSLQLIDDTMQSIWNQNFDKDDVYVVIVDFGSDDGTYEKILAYDSFHLGVYQVDRDFTKNRMVAETARIARHTYPGGEYCYRLILWPGDIIYPNYLSRLVQAMYQYRSYNVSMVISEVDVKEENGSVIRNANLFKHEKIIDGRKEYMEYVARGYQHNIMCFGGNVKVGAYRSLGENNERIWWNKSRYANFERNVVYLPERLSCIRACYYEDELREILLRWESLILFQRVRESKFNKKIQEEHPEAAECNLAYYALWRSFRMAQRKDMQQAESCFQISSVIYPDIKKKQIYCWLDQYVMADEQSLHSKIAAYFQTDSMA